MGYEELVSQSQPNPSSIEDMPVISMTLFFVVRVKDGMVTDVIKFVDDAIHPFHDAVTLKEYRLVILSLKHQTIHIFDILNGKLHPFDRIGWFRSNQEKSNLESTYGNLDVEPPNILSAFQQQLLKFFYCNFEPFSRSTSRFYQELDYILSLIMTRIKLLSHNHVIITLMSHEENV